MKIFLEKNNRGLLSRFFLSASFLLFPLLIVSAAAVDSDGDGYHDEEEIANGYSPFAAGGAKIGESDVDADGLNDFLELAFGSDPFNPDTDSDGNRDGVEVDWGYSPTSSSTTKLERSVRIDLSEQRLYYLVDGKEIKLFSVSSGKPSMPTKSGEYTITNKVANAWSRTYGLYMPYWLGLDRGRIGIHELPYWPGGYREGANHLWKAVSHGCVRLGIGPAQYIYDRLEVGSRVLIEE